MFQTEVNKVSECITTSLTNVFNHILVKEQFVRIIMFPQCDDKYVFLNLTINCVLNVTSPNTSSVDNTNRFERVIELYVISILCFFGLIGNILSVIVLQRDRDRREALFLLQALAFADTFHLLVAVNRYPLKYLIQEVSYVSMQLIVYPLLKTTQAMTVWMMLLVTTDRYIYVCRPLVAHQLCNSRTRRILALLVFVLSFVYNIPRFFDSCLWTFQDKCTGKIYSRRVFTRAFSSVYYFDIYQTGAYLLLIFIGPLPILIVLNYKLLTAIRRSRRRQRQYALCHMWQQPPHQSEANASIVLINVVIVFVICQTPELIFKILVIVDRWLPHVHVISANATLDFSTMSELLLVINSSVNFLIYCAFGRRFRHIMKETFRSMSHNM